MLQKHIRKVKFYPSADDFTQALLVMLVTNIMSDSDTPKGSPDGPTAKELLSLSKLKYVNKVK